jgi:hypothetical protein
LGRPARIEDKEKKEKLNHLGEERTGLTEMRLFLSRLAMKFHSITTAALNGDYHDTGPDFFPHSVLPSDREVNRLRAMVHQLNMGFSHTMREDGQKRKIVGQEHEAPGHSSVALPANFSSKFLSDAASGVNAVESSEETQPCVSREEMVASVEEVSNPVLYSIVLLPPLPRSRLYNATHNLEISDAT